MLIAGCTQCSGNLCYQVWRTWKKSQLCGSCPEGLLSQRKIENIFYRTDEVKVVEYILLDSFIEAAERLVYAQNKTKQCFLFLTLSHTEIRIAPKRMHSLIWLFVNIKNKIFGKIWISIFYPYASWREVLKNGIFKNWS